MKNIRLEVVRKIQMRFGRMKALMLYAFFEWIEVVFVAS